MSGELTARSVMTPCAELMMVEAGSDWGLILTEASQRHYDIVPHCAGGTITGVVWVSSAIMEPLAPRWLLSSDTSIPDLLEILADASPPVRLVLYGDEVVGLISAADLNRLPVRAYLYGVVGSLEVALARFVRGVLGRDSTDLLAKLTVKRQSAVKEGLRRMTEGGGDLDPIHLFFLSDLLNCIAGSEDCWKALGIGSKTQAEQYGGLNELRKRVMHPVRPLVESLPKDLEDLRKRLKRARQLLYRLEQYHAQRLRTADAGAGAGRPGEAHLTVASRRHDGNA